MPLFDFTAKPDYSQEDYLPGGIGEGLHFVARFLVTFESHPNGWFSELIALTHYTHFQHSTLNEEYSINTTMSKHEVLYGFWAGFNQKGEFTISSSGSESMHIPANKELEKAFLADEKVIEKLKLLMPNIKALGSIVFKRF